MPVTITIDDGPQSSPWLSNAIIPGQLNGNIFSPASGNLLARNRTYDFRVTVSNIGNDATEPPVGTGSVGEFISATKFTGGSTSPNGTSSASLSYSAGFPQLELIASNGRLLNSLPLSSPSNVSIPIPHVYGYSPSGKAFIVVTDNPLGTFNIYIIAAETIGTGTGIRHPGDDIYSTQISSSQGLTQFASIGIGFVPTQEVFYLTWAAQGSTFFQLINFGPNIDKRERESRQVIVSSAQAGQVLFSPSGNIMALIGQPSGISNDILLYKTPKLDLLTWTRRGLPITPLTVRLPYSLKAIKPSGFEAIEVRSGSDTLLIDSPTPARPAIAVYLWVDTSSSIFSTVTAKQYPQGTTGSTQMPSGFIDRIDANSSKTTLIDANWSAILPPIGQHFCAIAEAFTTQGTQPADTRQRTGNTLSLLERQIAQRNLVVV
jgi:hypothetical protein